MTFPLESIPRPSSGSNVGAGFDIKAGGAGLFAEGRFHDVFTDGENLKFIPITVGVRFGG